VDALDPDCPIFALMNQARRASWIVHHNIVGASLEDRLWGRITGTSDGVISWESAHSDKADSEIAVPAEHTSVQSHPLTILEVKRILLEHLAELHQEHSCSRVVRCLPTWPYPLLSRCRPWNIPDSAHDFAHSAYTERNTLPSFLIPVLRSPYPMSMTYRIDTDSMAKSDCLPMPIMGRKLNGLWKTFPSRDRLCPRIDPRPGTG